MSLDSVGDHANSGYIYGRRPRSYICSAALHLLYALEVGEAEPAAVTDPNIHSFIKSLSALSAVLSNWSKS